MRVTVKDLIEKHTTLFTELRNLKYLIEVAIEEAEAEDKNLFKALEHILNEQISSVRAITLDITNYAGFKDIEGE